MAVLPEAHLFQPPLEFRDGGFAGDLPQGGGVPEAGGLVGEHDVIPVGNAHKVVAARQGQQGGQVFNVVLVRLHVVGVAAVAAHADP